ncbi:hypothetical protein ACQPYA_07880 [Micromonospora sp. CA-263727]|uniref:TreTu family toxin n=1 Tax=Micromonospora sp. CA-263727 TaxID=3239967 RepID=UPI003D8E60D3
MFACDELGWICYLSNVQWNGQGTHRVASPRAPDTYRVAPSGDVYVEYEVPTDALRPHSQGASIIYGPNSLQARLPGRAQTSGVPFRNMSNPR